MRTRDRLVPVVALAALAAGASGCFGSSSSSSSNTAATVNTSASAKHTPVTLSFWSGYTGRELKDYQQAFAGFHQKYPWITVKGTGNIDDPKIIAAIHSGTAPDALLSFAPNNTGKFCSSGAWQNLNSYIQRDHVDLKQFPPAALAYSGFNGNQCSLPALTDAFGLYYNTAMLRKAGITHPPTTLDELAADAKKLTVRNSDGSIKVAGFVPIGTAYYQDTSFGMMQAAGAQWFDKNGKAILAKDPRWAKFLKWDRNLIDWYGADNLQRFVAGKGQEFSSADDFERGRVAMLYDGEWRNAFIKSDKSPVKYMTAAFPYLPGSASQAGSGVVGGNIVAIPKGAKHPAEAWLLIKYLATDTNALVGLSNRLQNLPTTKASLNSPALVSTPQFATFEKIFQNKASTFPPVTSSGQTYQDLWNAFFKRWEAGKIKSSDLQGSLASLDTQIDDQLAQQAAP